MFCVVWRLCNVYEHLRFQKTESKTPPAMAGSGKEDGKDINSPHQSRPGSVMQEEEAN